MEDTIRRDGCVVKKKKKLLTFYYFFSQSPLRENFKSTESVDDQ